MLYPVSDRHAILMDCLPCVLFDSVGSGVSFLFICKINAVIVVYFYVNLNFAQADLCNGGVVYS